jgi:hypothetical protein
MDQAMVEPPEVPRNAPQVWGTTPARRRGIIPAVATWPMHGRDSELAALDDLIHGVSGA